MGRSEAWWRAVAVVHVKGAEAGGGEGGDLFREPSRCVSGGGG